jgi:hypothetical protein
MRSARFHLLVFEQAAQVPRVDPPPDRLLWEDAATACATDLYQQGRHEQILGRKLQLG